MMKFLETMLTGMDGDISSKRVAAFVLLLATIVYIFVALALDRQDPTIVGILVGGVTGILVAQAVTRT